MIEICAELGHLELLRYLLRYRDCAFQMHDTHALCLAARDGNLEILEMLHELGVDLNAELIMQKSRLRNSSPLGRKALDLAASGGHEIAVRLLLDKGAELSEGVLQIASEKGHVPVVETLLQYGASPNTRDGWGLSPIHKAAIEGHSSVVGLLLQYGASPQTRSWFKHGPVSVVNGSAHIFYGDDTLDDGTAFHMAASCGHVPVLEVLKPEFTSVDYPLTEMCCNALHLAAEKGHLPTVRWLIENGAKVDAQNCDHHTCLDLAVQGRHTKTVRYLRDIADTSDVISSIKKLPDYSDHKGEKYIWELLVQRLCNSEEDTHGQRQIWLHEALDKARARSDGKCIGLLELEIHACT